jgi:hypothetical protein
MTTHCGECGSELCNHGNCPECNPCRHCYGGDRQNKYFGEDDPRSERYEGQRSNPEEDTP